jgi:hypothetical protein
VPENPDQTGAHTDSLDSFGRSTRKRRWQGVQLGGYYARARLAALGSRQRAAKTGSAAVFCRVGEDGETPYAIISACWIMQMQIADEEEAAISRSRPSQQFHRLMKPFSKYTHVVVILVAADRLRSLKSPLATLIW